MRYSVIDIGTNTMLLLIAEKSGRDGVIKTLADIQRVPRLGKGVDENRNIMPESLEAAADVLNEYIDISNKFGAEKIFATATSFIRDANNRDVFLKYVKDETGITVEVLSGGDEAKWTFIGGTFDKSSDGSNITVIDIGGGSTEITSAHFGVNSGLNDLNISGKSLDLGSVRLKEKFLSKQPPSFESIAKAEEFTIEQFKTIDSSLKNSSLIGVAGTITTLSALKLELIEFEREKVDGTVLTLNEIEAIFARLAAMQLEELYAMGDYMEGRADIIIPGILILQTFMEKFGFSKITVSTKGLRYGIFIREINKIK